MLKIFSNVNLKIIVERNHLVRGPDAEACFDVYVAHDFENARKLKDCFNKLSSSIDLFGQVYDRETWKEATIEIGSLLGYPKTAVEGFVNETPESLESEERKERMKRVRYYVFSAEHEKEEYEAYDAILNDALDKYTPRTAKLFDEKKPRN